MSKKSRDLKVTDLSSHSKKSLPVRNANLVRGGRSTSGRKKYMEIVMKEVVIR
ncbi:MAG TPA: hypothetical protein VH438_05345 [Gemmatimonadales bacterium]|jgi:hypothetical protein